MITRPLCHIILKIPAKCHEGMKPSVVCGYCGAAKYLTLSPDIIPSCQCGASGIRLKNSTLIWCRLGCHYWSTEPKHIQDNDLHHVVGAWGVIFGYGSPSIRDNKAIYNEWRLWCHSAQTCTPPRIPIESCVMFVAYIMLVAPPRE